MTVFTEPQRDLVLWFYKSRNPAEFSRVKGALNPRRDDQLLSTIQSLVTAEILYVMPSVEADSSANGKSGKCKGPVYNLTERGREIAANVKAALQDAGMETVKVGRK